ncbi:hypothetical protein [Muricoccus radiodurans]|uniref:hypothetical protein n=1 Tax=Muricoccus radiodurans TaxID=2231721 RepID=UPI003CF6ED17
MSGSLSLTPRRIAPQTGPIAWSAAEVPASERMIPLGAEHAAELSAPGLPTPKMDALAAELRGRLDHGRGFALLRGLPVGEDQEAPLRAIAERLGAVVPAAPASGSRHAEACDALLLRVAEASQVTLVAAAAVHNAILRADRAALSALYDPAEGAMTVFSAEGGVFGARWDDEALPAERAPALAAALEDPTLPLELDLRAGDILALNPFLVWASRLPRAMAIAVRTTPSQLDAAAFAPLRGAAG